jgi:hypothetical protein
MLEELVNHYLLWRETRINDQKLKKSQRRATAQTWVKGGQLKRPIPTKYTCRNVQWWSTLRNGALRVFVVYTQRARRGKRNTYKIFIRKPEGNKPLGRPRVWWENNIIIVYRYFCGCQRNTLHSLYWRHDMFQPFWGHLQVLCHNVELRCMSIFYIIYSDIILIHFVIVN